MNSVRSLAEVEIEALARRPLTAVVLRRLFLMLTREHFSHPENFGDLVTDLRDCVWSPSEPQRGLQISLQHDYDPRKVVKMLPCIHYGLGDTDFVQEVVQDMAEFSEDHSARHHVKAAHAPLQWCHSAATSDLASNLAETTFSFFEAIRGYLIRTFSLRSFNLMQIGMPRLEQPEGGIHYYRVDLRGVIDYNHVITVSEHSHRLKKVDLDSEVSGGLDLRPIT